MSDAPAVYDDLMVREYLEFFATTYNIHDKKRQIMIDKIISLTDLSAKMDSLVESLSRDTQQRLNLAHVLLHDPKILLLNKPTSKLDPRARVEIREILKELRSLDKTILISSHILS